MRASKHKGRVLLGVVALVFAPLFCAAPAAADWVVGIGNVTGACVQFDWRGGTATYSGSGAGVFSVDVNNSIDNRIGGGSTADSWSIWLNDSQVVSSNVIEQSRVIVPVSGDWVVTVQGIDNGFWAGWYGPQFCNPSFSGNVAPAPIVVPNPPYVPAPQPVGDYRLNEGWGAHIVAPAGQVIDQVTAWYGDPNDGNRGADESANYTHDLHGLVEADLNSGNYYGDPLPGVYKVLVASVTFMADPAVTVVAPSPTPEPTVAPTPEVIAPTEPTATPDPVSVDVRTTDARTEDVRPTEPVVPPAPEPQPSAPNPVLPPAVEPTIVQPVEPTPVPVDSSPTVEPETPAEPVQTEPAPEPIPVPETPAPNPPSEEITPATPVVEPTLPPTPKQPQTQSPTVATPPTPKPVEPTLPEQPKPSETSSPSLANATPAQIAEAINNANNVLNNSTPDSPEYQQALNVLAEAAVADDPQVPEAVANVPLVGPAAVAVLNAFNTLGNLGADISPHVRKKMKQVGSAVIVMGIAAGAGVRRK